MFAVINCDTKVLMLHLFVFFVFNLLFVSFVFSFDLLSEEGVRKSSVLG